MTIRRTDPLPVRTIGDILDVPTIRTVVSLEDRQDRSVRQELLSAFVPTEEARRVLDATARRLAEGHGSLMVMGGYGSGKSHLLLMLAELAEPESVLTDRPWWPRDFAAGLPPCAVTVSLVEHAVSRSLEEILLEAIGRRLDLPEVSTGAGDRRALWQVAGQAVKDGRYGSLLLLVDELSAYLRARTPVSALREDVRLLQYLGEQRTFPLTLVATLQESLERATEADPEAVRRLRDRYVTLPLTGAHLETIVTERLLRPRPGHDEATARVEARLRRALGRLPWEAERLRRLYPVHPGTLEHLEGLRHYLSATRGALDFLYRQLRGDPEHGIEALLEQPLGTWLTPDRLFDTFALRLTEAPETAPLVERVGSLYRTEGERLFGGEAPLARRIADLLCVEAAGVRPRARSATEIAQSLALDEFGLDPGLTELAVEAVLEQMVSQGAYVVREEGPLGPDDPTREEGPAPNGRYRVDPEADAALVVKRRLASFVDRARANGSMEDRVLLVRGALAQTDESLAVPVARLIRERESAVTVRWQQTERSGAVWCGDLRELTVADVIGWADENATAGHDFTVVVALPGEGRDQADARAHLETRLLPALSGREAGGSVAFWLPALWPDLDLVMEVQALTAMQREFATTDSAAAQGARAACEALLGERLPEVGRRMVERYFAGEWVLGSGESLGRLEGLSLMGFSEVLATLAKSLLEARHSAHGGVMPRLVPGTFPRSTWARIVTGLLTEGEAAASGDPEAAQAIDGVLVPLGLAAKHGHGYQVRLDPQRSPALAGLLGTLAGEAGSDPPEARRVPLAQAERRLMKGPLGLDWVSARLTVLTATLGGLAGAYAHDRRVPLSRLKDLESLEVVDSLSLGGASESRSVPESLGRLPFLGPRAEGAYLPARQRELWARAVKWKAERQGRTADEAALLELSHHPLFRAWDFAQGLRDLASQAHLLSQIAVSLPPLDGLGRLAEASEAEGPDVAIRLAQAEEWSTFLATTAERLIRQERYLRHGAFGRLEAIDAGLEGGRRSLLERLASTPGLTSRESREAWLADSDAWAQDYARLYTDTHRRAVGSDPTATVAMLEKRHGAPWAEADRTLRDGILGRYCRLTPGRALAVEPVCPCGFRLGDQPLTESLAAYAEMLAAHQSGRPAAAVPVPVADGRVTTGPGDLPRAVLPANGPSIAAADRTSGLPPGNPDAAGGGPVPTSQDGMQGAPFTEHTAVRRMRDLTEALAIAQGERISASELRRRFEAWLRAAPEEEIEIRS